MSIRGTRGPLLVDRWVVGAALAAGAWLAAYAVATAVVHGTRGELILANVVYHVPLAAGSALLWAASFRTHGRQRLFWSLLAAGLTSWLAGEVTWSVIELGLGREVPTPSLADVFYLGWYAAILTAIPIAFWPGVRARGLRTLLDTSVITAAVGVAGWKLLIEPQLEYGASLGTVFGILYPLLDVVALMLLSGLALAARRDATPAIALIVAGLAVGVLADGVYTHAWVSGAYDTGSWIDLGWQLQALLNALAAVAVLRGLGSRARPVETTGRDRGMPLVLAGSALAGALVTVEVFGEVSTPVELLAVAGVAAVVGRLLLTSRERAQDAARLDALLAEQTELTTTLQRRTHALDVQARALAHSLTQHERVELELEASVAALQATLDATADALLVVDAERRIVGTNANFVELWGIPEDVLRSGKDQEALAFVLGQLRDPDGFLAKVQELYEAPDAESFDELEFKDGRLVERYSKPHRVAGRPGGRVWSFRDVTERSRLETELRQAQKMEAVGRLAGGIAHDFNNLLTAISGYSELVLDEVETPSVRRSVEEIHGAAERAGRLTGQLLAFSRKQMLQPTVVDLDEVVGGLHALLAPLLGETIGLTSVRSAACCTNVLVDRGQLEQVIVNLVINARDAMPDGGRISIETDRTGDEVVLRVRDTGHGMDEPTLASAFEPFFTTKEPGAGTGLGLATVLGIVEQSGGRIAVDTRPGEGSTFELTFPAVDAEAHDDAGPPATWPGDSRGTVLLVEDEAVVRTLLERVLVAAGFSVLVAEQGEAALALAAAHAGPIDVLLTDVVMPGMSGRELAERLLVDRPATPVVYMSGYTDDVLQGLHESAGTFLQKPFRPADVVGTLSDLLARRAA